MCPLLEGRKIHRERDQKKATEYFCMPYKFVSEYSSLVASENQVTLLIIIVIDLDSLELVYSF